MDLSMISTFFDNDPLYDAYTGLYLYDGQFATYDGSQLDGSFVRRRTVSLGADLELPPRRVVTLYGEQWVLSDPIKDGFCGDVVRQTMSARKCHHLYGIMTAGQLAEDLPPVREAYGFARWTKNTADAATSELEPYYEFSFALSEVGIAGKFFTAGGNIWHARMATEVSEGFMFAEADCLTTDGDPTIRIEIERPGAKDPVTLQAGPSTFHKAVIIERYQFFRKLDQAQQNNYHGDKTLVVAKAPELEGQGSVLIAGKAWEVIGRQDLGDGWALHIRRAT